MFDSKFKKTAQQGPVEENRLILAIRNPSDYDDEEKVLSGLPVVKEQAVDLLTCQWSAREHWELQVAKLMSQSFLEISALPKDLLEKYLSGLARKFSSQNYLHQPAMTPMIVFPQNLLPLSIKLKLLNARLEPVPNTLLPTPVDFTRFWNRSDDPTSVPHLVVGLEMKKNRGLASKVSPMFIYPLNGKRDLTLDEGLMLVYFYGSQYKLILKGTIYFSETREKYWPVLEYHPESASYGLRISSFRDHEPEAFVPSCHKRVY
jgi:hypothetical protein